MNVLRLAHGGERCQSRIRLLYVLTKASAFLTIAGVSKLPNAINLS
jgi:hypothetical protein